MKRIFKNKKGVTVLEGLIALLLLAMISVGTFSVLLSASRKSSQPDQREAMTLSMERAVHALQVFAPTVIRTDDWLPAKPDLETIANADPTSTLSAIFQSIHGDPMCVTTSEADCGELDFADLLPVADCQIGDKFSFDRYDRNLGYKPEQNILRSPQEYEMFALYHHAPDNGGILVGEGAEGTSSDNHHFNHRLLVRKFQIVCRSN